MVTMIEILKELWHMPGLFPFLGAALIAGTVYGFAGFGAALLFMPVASAFVPLPVAIGALSISALSSLVTVLPRALGQVERNGLLAMLVAGAIGSWIGLYLLEALDLTILRWAVVSTAAITLSALVFGLRLSIPTTIRNRALTGVASGFVGGATGLTGPVLVLVQLASGAKAKQARATTVVFLTALSTMVLPMMAWKGLLNHEAIILGVAMFLPYGLGARLGQAMFRPERESLYKKVAYSVIFVAIVLGLPVEGLT